MSDTVPSLIADAPNDNARRARRAAAEALAQACQLDLESACALASDAATTIRMLPTSERRWLHTLRTHRVHASTIRGLSMAGDGAFRAADHALATGAAEVATAAGAEPDSPLHLAIRSQLLSPLPEDD